MPAAYAATTSKLTAEHAPLDDEGRGGVGRMYRGTAESDLSKPLCFVVPSPAKVIFTLPQSA